LVDANEAWKDPETLLRFMEGLTPFHIEFVEQPLPSTMVDEYLYLKPRSPYTLMADESICADADFESLKKQFHGVNMKLMKAGGYRNGIRLLKEAKQHGLKTMVGCMVETTLGMQGAWHLCALSDYADLDGYLVIKDEPFGMLKEEDGLVKMAARL
jgi:L-alanine-DL-glutamate epimerase-like enolase superfamily enzyme